MKRIGITQRVYSDHHSQIKYDCLDHEWSVYLMNLNYLPLMLPNLKLENDINGYLSSLKLDGLILSGGNDLAVTNGKDISQRRDLFESILVEYAINNDVPLLGVCRGMQMLNLHFGGHIRAIDYHVNPNHSIKFKTGVLAEVNSYHHWGIEMPDLSSQMEVLAEAETGVVECITHKVHQIMGIMWHPERKNKSQQMTDQILKDLFQ